MKAMLLGEKNDPGKCALLVWPLVGSDFMALCSSSRAEKHGTSVIVRLVKRGFQLGQLLWWQLFFAEEFGADVWRAELEFYYGNELPLEPLVGTTQL